MLSLESKSSTNANGNFTLGYNWNNDGNAFNWDSGLVPPIGQWSMVALVVTPTNATIYIGNTNGLASSVHVLNHAVQASAGPFYIGADPFVLDARLMQRFENNIRPMTDAGHRLVVLDEVADDLDAAVDLHVVRLAP